MSLYDIIISRRSIRQFNQKPISKENLKKFVNAARLAPSAANRQPLEFVVVENKDKCRQLYPCFGWAAYISPAGDPVPGQEPVAYIVVLANTEIRSKGYEWDSGAAIENIILSAWEEGIGSCWLQSVDKRNVKDILNIPAEYKIDSVIAFGYPAENPVAEDIGESVKYWKDQNGRLHVPKRKLAEVIHFDEFC